LEAHHAVLRGDRLLLVGVDLHELEVVALGGERLERRRQGAARGAPGRPEVDEDDRLRGLEGLGGEGGGGGVGGGVHGRGMMANAAAESGP
jgi:hypothetical protein